MSYSSCVWVCCATVFVLFCPMKSFVPFAPALSFRLLASARRWHMDRHFSWQLSKAMQNQGVDVIKYKVVFFFNSYSVVYIFCQIHGDIFLWHWYWRVAQSGWVICDSPYLSEQQTSMLQVTLQTCTPVWRQAATYDMVMSLGYTHVFLKHKKKCVSLGILEHSSYTVYLKLINITQ